MIGDLTRRELSAHDAQAALQLGVQLAQLLTGARRVSLVLVNEEGEAWLAAGEGLGIAVGEVVELGPGIASEVLKTRRPLLVEDLGQTEFPPHPERGYLTGTCMAVPVAWGDTLHGVLCAADPEDGECFTSHDLMILQLLGEQLAAGINALGRARTLADLDDLTGVQNRRAFEARLAAEVERSRRYGRPLSLAMVDVDGLKRLNERGGRRLGDEVLQRVAEVLLRTVRRVDTVGRYGGDEFAVLLPETGATEALIAAQRLADAVRALAIPGADGALAVRVSIGASSWPPASNVEDLVDQAYRALYAAKRSREGVRHWQLGSGLPQPHGYPCTCRTCGRVFMVAGLAQQRVRRYCSLECAASARRQPKRDRNETIRALRASGLTLREIAERYGISEERVRQICRDGGV